jgi:hypothetical protein
MYKRLSFILIWLLPAAAMAQKNFTKADTLRGSLTPERTWWDVQRYELAIKPDYTAKSLSGSNEIKYKVVRANNGSVAMQIDMAEPLVIDSVIYNQRQALQFGRYESVWHIKVPAQQLGANNSVLIYYHGKVHEAIRPPWDGGFIFAKDSLGRPYMTVAWYPNKDHQSDEPDKGASLTMTVPDSLTAIGNGRLVSTKNNNDGTTTTRYNVVNPISNYCIIPYIGKYVSFKEVYKGEKGPLDVQYHVLDYNGARARTYMPEQVHLMFKSMEHWFGPYPFYEDGYQLIDAAHTGMEHQSAVSYGNGYRFGYRGRDASGYGWGLKYDFIIIHESGHEWFGNNITTNDLADMWIHEGFTNYSETLFADTHYGAQAANEYNYGIRKGIRNDSPITPAYNVNAQGSGDMYPKAGNMIHSIRHSLDNDELFRQVLRGLNKEFYHKTVNASQVEAYISKKAGYNYGPVFTQYITTTQIPQLDYYIEKGRLYYRYSNAVKGFNLPIVMRKDKVKVKFIPGAEWKNITVTPQQAALLDAKDIEFMYYLKVNKEK